MSSKLETAEQRYRAALERLKAGTPKLLPHGTSVSQNNVAKEAGTDPTALKKARYPALIREIKALVEINNAETTAKKERQTRQRRARDDAKAANIKLQAQRDHAQSQLVCAHRRLLELLQENATLQSQLNQLIPPPTPLR